MSGYTQEALYSFGDLWVTVYSRDPRLKPKFRQGEEQGNT